MYDVFKRLEEIKIEDYIWVIYIIIIFMSIYANELEKKYFLYNDLLSKDKYRNTLITIFTILVIVYMYYLNNSIIDIKNLNIYDSLNKKNLTYLSFIASLLITISGFILLYIAINDKKIDVEIAFN